DANGRNVTTDIAIVDRLSIGGVTFRSVPVLIHDFSSIDPNGCFFAGGVIVSEIFLGCACRIATERHLLQIAARAEALSTPDVSQPSLVAPLHDFGYPHAPVFDYRIGSFEDRGLFDTGSSETITLFARVAQDTRVKQAMIPDSIRVGRGSEGVSAGGV